jgi:hypothetical protein
MTWFVVFCSVKLYSMCLGMVEPVCGGGRLAFARMRDYPGTEEPNPEESSRGKHGVNTLPEALQRLVNRSRVFDTRLSGEWW